MIVGEMYVESLICSYVAVCRLCAVCCVVSLLFASLFYFLITGLVFNTLLCLFSCFIRMFSILCIAVCFCIVLCTVSPFVYSCLFPIFIQVYRPLPTGGNPIAVRKYRIISYHVARVGRREMRTGCWQGDMKERDILKDLGIDGKII
jgi:hypothetical protein